jgi:hypothetical protein
MADPVAGPTTSFWWHIDAQITSNARACRQRMDQQFLIAKHKPVGVLYQYYSVYDTDLHFIFVV